jgi:RND family efflux transporter MFP subunit
MTVIHRQHVLTAFAAILLSVLLGGCGSDENAATNGERAVTVTIARVEEKTVQTRLRSIGRLVSRNAPVLASEIDARVIEILADEGQPVREGQVLVRLDTTPFELARREAQAAIDVLEVSIANEEKRVARYRDLKVTNALPQERLDDAEAKLAVDRASKLAAEARLAITEDRLTKSEIRSPVDGTIERRHVSIGDFASAGKPVMTVSDTLNLRAELPFPETVGHLLRPGQGIVMESLLAPGLEHEAEITRLRPDVGSMNRSLAVLVDLDNPGPWRPEATVKATVVVDERPGALIIPVASLVERPSGSVVYLLDDAADSRVREQTVEPGESQNGMIEILAGLEAGQVVVRDGAAYLTDGAAVEVRGDDS